MSLSEIIIQRIKDEGPISFHDFMEMALYYPGLGYYTSAQNKIGMAGDFYTAANLTPAFGAAISRQLEEMWEIMGRKNFTIVEYGAGTGTLCHDILNCLKANEQLYDQLSYCIIEKSPAMQEMQKAHLHEKVSWYQNIAEITELNGCIISNELVDNFSIHQVEMQDELLEIFVDYKDAFVEVLLPAAPALKNYLDELKVNLPKGYRTEINLEAIEWLKEMASALRKGYVITIDYGYEAHELYNERRSSGTLLCYHKHEVSAELYSNIGGQDITSFVNFSALCHWGNKLGLICCGLANQPGFLLSLGFKDYLRKNLADEPDLVRVAKKEAFITYTMLVEMGNKFKVLIQRKGTPGIALLGLTARYDPFLQRQQN